jgi:hypothetical protein
MKQLIRSKILRKFLTLACLIIGLVFVASTDFSTRTVKADSCLSDCAGEWAVCNAGCDDPDSWYPGCYTVCLNGYNYCKSLCPH